MASLAPQWAADGSLASVVAAQDPPSDDLWRGPTLAAAGGACYALGALITSYMAKNRDAAPERWPEQRIRMWNFFSWVILNIGGLSVTFAFMSQASVPFMNTIVYSVNLILNMLLQIWFQISSYTKVLRVGTLLFALSTVQLTQMAPLPEAAQLEQLWQPMALLWWAILTAIIVGSGFGAFRTSNLPKSSYLKTGLWAIQISGVSSALNNMARVNGLFDMFSATWWFIFVPYALLAGGFMMTLSVMAYARTDVRIFVPVQLCTQLLLNVISAFAVWEESGRVNNVTVYGLTYAIAVMSIYIATEEADITASVLLQRDVQNKALGPARRAEPSQFGESIVQMLRRWQEPIEGAPGSMAEAQQATGTRDLIKDFIIRGADAVAFKTENLVDLILRLWTRAGAASEATGDVVLWMKETDFYRDYVLEDPGFDQKFAVRRDSALTPTSRGASWLVQNSMIKFSPDTDAPKEL